jgi:lysophospholipase L1-like esterase
VAILKPDIVVIETASPNDGVTTQAGFNGMLAKAVAFADACVRAGAVPILKTATPFYTYTTTTDPMRVAMNATVRGIGASGSMLVLDADNAVSDSASPLAAIQSRYIATSDGHHLNDAGHSAIAAALVPLLQQLIS